MNYTDFGVNGPDELEQDEWSLTRPTFETPKGGTLTVVGWKGRSGKGKRYLTICGICSNDKELFGDGLFGSLKFGLSRGFSPCGCSVKHTWSEDQYRIRAKREAISRGCDFNGWAGIFNGRATKVALSCAEHGEWITTRLDSFLQGCGCWACARKSITLARVKKDTIHIEGFMSSGKFPSGAKFCRSSKGIKFWDYTCPKCSHDKYVRAGLCSGVFESTLTDLRSGQIPCRCSSAPRWTQEQRRFQIEEEMSLRREDGRADLQFVRWESEMGQVNKRRKFTYLCLLHGEGEMSVDNFLRGKGCPGCAGRNQLQAYINVVVDEEIPVAIKLGIANNSDIRLSCQNRSNLFQSSRIGVWKFKEVKDCKASEAECKQTLQTGILSAREMKDGHTETLSTLDLEKVIAIYEKHGGVRIK